MMEVNKPPASICEYKEKTKPVNGIIKQNGISVDVSQMDKLYFTESEDEQLCTEALALEEFTDALKDIGDNDKIDEEEEERLLAEDDTPCPEPKKDAVTCPAGTRNNSALTNEVDSAEPVEECTKASDETVKTTLGNTTDTEPSPISNGVSEGDKDDEGLGKALNAKMENSSSDKPNESTKVDEQEASIVNESSKEDKSEKLENDKSKLEDSAVSKCSENANEEHSDRETRNENDIKEEELVLSSPTKSSEARNTEELEDDIILLDSPVRSETSQNSSRSSKIKSRGEADEEEEENKPKIVINQNREVDSDDDDVVLLDMQAEEAGSPEKVQDISENEDNRERKTENSVKDEDQKSQSDSSIPDIIIKEDDYDVVLLDSDDDGEKNSDREKSQVGKCKGTLLEDADAKFDAEVDVVVLDDDKTDINDTNKNNKSCESINKEIEQEVESEEIFSIEVGRRQTCYDDVVKHESRDSDIKSEDETQYAEEIKREDESEKTNPEKEGKSNTSQENDIKAGPETTQKDENVEKIVSDNSDNARDKFVEVNNDNEDQQKESSENDVDLLKTSSRSQHSKTSNSNDFANERKTVEIKNSDSSKQPPLKKKRISQDTNSISEKPVSLENEDSRKSNKDENADQQTEEKIVENSKSLKRSLSSLQDSNETKKQKLGECTEEVVEKIDDKNDMDRKDEVPVDMPPSEKKDISLEFMKKFKTPFSKMTRSQLEELVLQKVTEALMYKSEYSQLYELVEKQGQILKTYQNKCKDLTKQLHDLEMVHTYIARDLQTKNSQIVMPVKITRAVGLQVHISKNYGKVDDRGVQPPPLVSSVNNVPPQAVAIPSTSKMDLVPIRGRCMQKTTPMRPGPETLHPPGQSLFLPSTSQSRAVTPQKTNATLTLQQSPQQKSPPKPVRQIPPPPPMNQQNYSPQFGLHQPISRSSSPPHILNAGRKPAATRQPIPPIQKPQQQTQTDRPKVPVMLVKKNSINGKMTVTNCPPNTSTNAQAQANTSPAPSGQKSFIDLTDDEEGPRKNLQQTNVPALVAIPPSQNIPRTNAYAANGTKANIIKPSATSINHNGTSLQRSITNKQSNYAPKQTTVQNHGSVSTNRNSSLSKRLHPAPLPKPPPATSNPLWKAPPPTPDIRINKISSGIVISWTMDSMKDRNAEITCYQIYAYQETPTAPSVDLWRHVGDVKAMLLPMAVTLTQFQEGQRYYFAVRAVDVHNRIGFFSEPKTW